MTEHTILSRKTYLLVYVALLVLLVLTVGAAFLELGPFGSLLALVIAFTKAVLVTLFFMHVRYSDNLIRLLAGVGLLFLFIMIVLTLSDYLTRLWIPTIGA